MKKILFLTSLLLFVCSVASFAQILLPQDKKVLKEETIALENQEIIEESKYDCDQIEYQVIKKDNQYEVVLKTKGPKPHHWELEKVSAEGTDSVLTTQRNRIIASESGEYILTAMTAEDEVLCVSEINIVESNARGAQAFNRWTPKKNYRPVKYYLRRGKHYSQKRRMSPKVRNGRTTRLIASIRGHRGERSGMSAWAYDARGKNYRQVSKIKSGLGGATLSILNSQLRMGEAYVEFNFYVSKDGYYTILVY